MIRAGNHYRLKDGTILKLIKKYPTRYYHMYTTGIVNSDYRDTWYRADIQKNIDRGMWIFVPRREVVEYIKNWELL